MVIDDIEKLMKQNNQQGFAVVIDDDDDQASVISTVTNYKKCAFLIGFVIAEMIQNSDSNTLDLLEDVTRAVYLIQTERRHVEHREVSA